MAAPMTGRLPKFIALPGAAKHELLAAAALLPLFRAGLHLFGFARLRAWIARSPAAAQAPPPIDELSALGALVNTAARHTLGPANCLTRSLYLWWRLRRSGIDSELRIGVRLNDGVLDGHAWVECAGVPINDRPDVSADFTPFDAPLPPGSFSAP